MQEAWIVSACRTAIGNFGGTLANVEVSDLGCVVIKEAIVRAQIVPYLIEEVIMGHAIQAGTGQGVTKVAAVKAGIPETVSAYSVNNVCGSGLRAVNISTALIQSGQNDVIVAGGMENMSQAPYLLPNMRFNNKIETGLVLDALIKDGLTDSFENYQMGITAERIADKYNITRCQQDEYACMSQNRAKNAILKGYFESEIVPISINKDNYNIIFHNDEHCRKNVTMQSISSLSPIFTKMGTVTVANSSSINDGAASLVIVSTNAVKRHNLMPIAKILQCVSVGVNHKIMGMGSALAIKRVLKKANLHVYDIDLFEINEAFAAQVIAVQKELCIDINKVNVSGGAIALGHPIGASGARILVTLINNLIRYGGKYGIASICVGGGMGVATLIEMVNKRV